MDASAKDLREAKESAGALLERLGLEAYLFEVEPREGPWEVRIDCAIDGGWQSVVLTVDRERLLASRTDARRREDLLADWRRALLACRSG